MQFQTSLKPRRQEAERAHPGQKHGSARKKAIRQSGDPARKSMPRFLRVEHPSEHGRSGGW